MVFKPVGVDENELFPGRVETRLLADFIVKAGTNVYGRGLLAALNAAEGRGLLELGTAATVNTGTSNGTVPVLGASGTLAIARLATGAPDGTKYVRDDGTLATPPGGGGGAGATTLDELLDVVVTAPVLGHVLRHNGTNFVNVLGTTLYQAADPELAALAGLTSAADSMPYYTGAGTASVTTLTAFARTLLDDANGAAMIATLGAQAADAELAAIAGLVSAADRLPYYTGVGTASLATFTAFARTLVDDADATSMLTTLGVSTFIKTLLDDVDASTALSTLGVSTFIKTLLDDADAATARTTLGVAAGTTRSSSASSATPTPVVGTDRSFYRLTAQAAAAAFAVPTGTPQDGDSLVVSVKDNATARALTWNAVYRDLGPGLPATTVVSKWMVLTFLYNATDTKWDLVGKTNQP